MVSVTIYGLSMVVPEHSGDAGEPDRRLVFGGEAGNPPGRYQHEA